MLGDDEREQGRLDAVGFAVRIENRYKGLRAPHKLKSAVSGCVRECAEAQSKDFGLVATESGYNLYLCGNGGSMADAQHISAEMLKSFVLPRPLGADRRHLLAEAGPDGKMLGQVLQRGLRAMVLGLNHSLTSALENDVSS